MHISNLQLNGFRNYAEQALIPSEGLNILHGDNAQGKSNVLEAIALLATTRSFRALRESEMVGKGFEEGHVVADLCREREGNVEVQVSIYSGEKKAVRVNGMKRARVLDLLGEFNAVSFGSLDLRIVTGDPADRRHFLNVEISQISPRYVHDLGHYKRILEQRNRLLKDLRERPCPPEESGLLAWNTQLIRYGAPIYEKRRFFIERLAPLAQRIHFELTNGKEVLEVKYLPSIILQEKSSGTMQVREDTSENRYLTEASQQASVLPTKNEANEELQRISEAFRCQMVQVANDEARRGTTLIGPQRDDLSFVINGNDARVFGSQGQQRTVALALKLAEFRLIEDFVGEPPVLLLDDVMSDLDDARRHHLLNWTRRRCQTFLTCTNLRSFPDDILSEARTYHVCAGRITPDV